MPDAVRVVAWLRDAEHTQPDRQQPCARCPEQRKRARLRGHRLADRGRTHQRNFVGELGFRTNCGDRASDELDGLLGRGDFLVNLATLRVDYTFSPKMTIRSLTQYNTSTNEISNNIRFNLIHHAGSDLYVVYNDLSQTGLPADIFGRKDLQFVVTATYLLQR
jgi:hypothetical protein